MADTVDTITIFSSPHKLVRRFTNVSDASGESAVVKVDKSALTGPEGIEPRKLVVLSLRWAIQGFTSVRLFFDHTTDDEIVVLSGNGYEDYGRFGGLVDPATAGGTGDILLTTAGAASGATYDITLEVELRAA